MNSNNNDAFALQRLYERWVVKDEWLLYDEAIPLLLGLDPTLQFTNVEVESLRLKVKTAIGEGRLQVSGEGAIEKQKVKPAAIYRWAMANSLTLPVELVNLMEFVLKTVLSTESVSSSRADDPALSDRSDIERILGACLALVASYPDECKNARGMITVERLLKLLDAHAEILFNGEFPAMSSTAIRDTVNHWLNKLR